VLEVPLPVHHAVSNAVPPGLDYIHRSVPGAEIYFVANPSNGWQYARCTFRVSGKAPEIWDPISGRRRFAPAYQESQGRTTMPLEFAPCGSWFVIFREPATRHAASAQENWLSPSTLLRLTGDWEVGFDPHWGGPEKVHFDDLVSWPMRVEPGIKYYSGMAMYRKQFDLLNLAELAASTARKNQRRLYLNLGMVYELAQVRLNGRDLGVVWAPPFRVDITDAVKRTGNTLEIEVVNFWPNRIIGDQSQPPDRRFTRTNIRQLTKDSPLMESGLLGPVRVE
jgi:hypothetical protein